LEANLELAQVVDQVLRNGAITTHYKELQAGITPQYQTDRAL